MSDPTLSAAADTIEPILEKSFPQSYAGLALDHTDRLIAIYRRPDPSLDAAVRRAVPGVRVAFRDARFTLVQLRELAGRIMADRSYWVGRGIEIQSAAPLVDGSGVRVGTTQGTARQATLLAQRYHVPGEITVERISVVADQDGAHGFVPDVGKWPLPATPA